jgi:AraC-like DNA-binding protein
MAEPLFALDRANYHDCQSLFRGERAQEYYRGDYWVEAADGVDVRAERRAVGPHSIIRVRSATRQFFRRTRQHIREDATDLCVLWFVKRGQLNLSGQGGSQLARPGDFLITRSMSPFFIECDPDEHGVHEVLNVTVPTHVLRTHIVRDVAASLLMPMRRELSIAEMIFSELFAGESGIAEDLGLTLMEAALSAVGHAVRQSGTVVPARRTMAKRRLEEVLRFMEVRLSDPAMSTAMVSRGCGISPRYLSFLLRSTGTSFSELAWSRRLERAKEWLATSGPEDISISEIAYGVGFKSSAHFSRMFKRVFKVNPREFRAGAAQAPGHLAPERDVPLLEGDGPRNNPAAIGAAGQMDRRAGSSP